MADIFLREDALKTLKGKQIIFIGDSIQRNIYQDLVTLLCKVGVKRVNNTGQLTPEPEFSEELRLASQFGSAPRP